MNLERKGGDPPKAGYSFVFRSDDGDRPTGLVVYFVFDRLTGRAYPFPRKDAAEREAERLCTFQPGRAVVREKEQLHFGLGIGIAKETGYGFVQAAELSMRQSRHVR